MRKREVTPHQNLRKPALPDNNDRYISNYISEPVRNTKSMTESERAIYMGKSKDRIG